MIYRVFPRDSFIINISMYFGATSEVACSDGHSDRVLYIWRERWTRPLEHVSLIAQFVE